MKGLKILRNFWEDDSGQTTTEYILILAVVVMIAMKFKGQLQERLNKAVDGIGKNIDSVTSGSE